MSFGESALKGRNTLVLVHVGLLDFTYNPLGSVDGHHKSDNARIMSTQGAPSTAEHPHGLIKTSGRGASCMQLALPNSQACFLGVIGVRGGMWGADSLSVVGEGRCAPPPRHRTLEKLAPLQGGTAGQS